MGQKGHSLLVSYLLLALRQLATRSPEQSRWGGGMVKSEKRREGSKPSDTTEMELIGPDGTSHCIVGFVG